MQGGPATAASGDCYAVQSWLELHPLQRAASAASLSVASFPSKPPGADQSTHHQSHATTNQALYLLHHCQADLLNHHRHPDLAAPSPFDTGAEEDDIAIYGSHSFTFSYSGQPDLYRTSIGSRPSDDTHFAPFSDSLTKQNPHQDPIYSVPLPFHAPYQRSLTFNQHILNYEMTTTTTAPNSPPDLSGSRSSKSSSFQSSQFDGPDGITNDVSNFEEIGLEEDTTIQSKEAAAWNRSGSVNRSSSRVSLIGSQPLLPARELTTSHKRPTYPSLQGQVKNALDKAKANEGGLPRNGPSSVAGLKRGFTAPPITTPPMLIPGCPPRTRSSSPSPKLPASASFATTGHNVRSGPLNKSAGLRTRRGSWQPSRKTVKELEAEYHDSDDELPIDASLWNVPMSPRPPIDRPSSTRSSNRGSPERDIVSNGPRPIPLSHEISAPNSPPRLPMSQSLPRNQPPPRTSSLYAARSTTNSPTRSNAPGFYRDGRAKSWTLAMAELSEEARVLTETLESHADSKGRQHEENIQNGVKSSRASLESATRRSARSSTIELPPIQKGNILIDPMPLSKEKEAVLTRTRPSWLPPKDPKEEKRHLKEYQRMMAASVDAERRREDKVKVRQCEKDDSREALDRMWEQYVYPDWDRVTHEHRTRELWWRGVSPKVRGQIWMRAMGNSLGLSDKSYAKALQRVKDLQGRKIEDLNEKERTMRAWCSDIEKDAKFAFPELNLFHQQGPMWRDLVDVCCAYISYRSDVGYFYGVQVSHCELFLPSTTRLTISPQMIAALMLIQIPAPADVFILLANCLNAPLALAFLTNDTGSTAKALQHADSTLQYKFPRLHSYLFRPLQEGGLEMHPAEIFEAIFLTLLTNGLDIEKLVRVWDCFVFEGDRIIMRSAVALLGCLQAQIFGFEGSPPEKRRMIRELLGWGPTGRVHGYWDVRGDADSFMAHVKEAGKVNPEEE